ncbi:putative baseplate assembly protein [Streptomyces sp. 8N706]|uniref:putative baseplate assembly protein n=1 Tax=Streptomyces sp. 8N706 TaxID=3457416 RepID=UPI003FD1E53E
MSGRCGCGGRAGGRAPGDMHHPPGRDTLEHRTGTYGRFLDAMLGRLASPAYPALHRLTMRTPDDPAIGLLDAWAVLGDLLSFHSERMANEGYLRTATDERSLALLGRLVGHRPRPGVAADTHLAYALDRDPRSGEDVPVLIPRGARSQSVPGPDEEPQTFETWEDLTARWSWNELRVRLRRPYQLTARDLRGRSELYAAGTANNIKPGDQLLAVFSAERSAPPEQRALLHVPWVRIDRNADVTVVGLPQPALPSLERLVDEVQKWITPGRTAPVPRPEGSPLIEDFDAQVLAPLRADLDLLDTPTRFVERLEDTVERLREAQALAEPYDKVADWFAALASALVELQQQARELEPAQPDSGDGSPGPEEPDHPALRALGRLLPALRTRVVRPPAGARQLARDPERIFAPDSDVGARLLAALDPRLQDGLYDAWRQADPTVPRALRELRAMRVTATPFGATAPLKPVHDSSGRVVRYDDWPLTGSKLVSMRIVYDEQGAVPSRAEFLYAEAGGSVQKTQSLPWNDSFDFGPGRIELTTHEPPEPDPEPGPRARAAARATPDAAGAAAPKRRTRRARAAVPEQEPGVTAVLREDLPERTLFVSRPAADGTVHVTVTNGATLDYRLAPGEQQRGTHGGLEVTVRRSPAGEPAAVEVALAAKLELTSRNVIALDAVYDGIALGSWVVVQRPRKGSSGQVPGDPKLAFVVTRVAGVRVVSRADFGITGKVTELTLEDPWLDDQDVLLSYIRDATVLARGEPVELADEPVVEDVHGREIELAGLYDGLAPGRWIVVSGERTDIPGAAGVRGTELAMIAAVDQNVDPDLPGDTVRTTITLTAGLAYRYRRDSVRIQGNVVRATHGASRDEPIGSGDAARANQSFTLWQGPLTWLADDSPLGAVPTLEVRVGGVLWHEVDSLAGRGPGERVYVTGVTEDGRTTVTFGDGVRGARLPTGQENVRARYRVGIGRDANVRAERITQPTTRPLGVSGVTNPQPATGGADPDGPGLARRTIPLAVSALDRLVSLPDYEDFARSRAAIGRASARELFTGRRRSVHVTVAGVDDVPLAEDSDVLRTLRASLARHGDTRLPVDVAVRELVLLVLVAGVKVHPDHSWDLVEPRIRQALLRRLGYPGRALGQPAHLSEVLATAQSVPGVDHVDVDAFTGVPASITPDGLEQLAGRLAQPRTVVPARLAEYAEERYRVTADGGETLTDIAARHGISLTELLRLNPDITDTRPLCRGRSVFVFRGVRPAQLALFSPDVADTLILTEVTS